MKLWKLKPKGRITWNMFEAVVVAAETEEEAVMVRPGGNSWNNPNYSDWPSNPKDVSVEYLGVTDRQFKNPIISACYLAG